VARIKVAKLVEHVRPVDGIDMGGNHRRAGDARRWSFGVPAGQPEVGYLHRAVVVQAQADEVGVNVDGRYLDRNRQRLAHDRPGGGRRACRMVIVPVSVVAVVVAVGAGRFSGRHRMEMARMIRRGACAEREQAHAGQYREPDGRPSTRRCADHLRVRISLRRPTTASTAATAARPASARSAVLVDPAVPPAPVAIRSGCSTAPSPATSWPRISPAGYRSVWTLTYAFPPMISLTRSSIELPSSVSTRSSAVSVPLANSPSVVPSIGSGCWPPSG